MPWLFAFVAPVLTLPMQVAQPASTQAPAARPAPAAVPAAPLPAQGTPVPEGKTGTSPETVRPLRLAEALDIARKNQPTLHQAHGATESAAGRSDQIRGGLLPQVSLNASAQRVHGTSRVGSATTTNGVGATPVATAGTTDATYNLFSLGASATQLIWDFGQTYGRYKSADRTTDSFRATELTADLAVALNVRRAYFTASGQRALARVSQDALTNLEKHLAQIQGFVTAGTRPEIDLAQARTDVANGRVALIDATNAYEVARAQLNQAMGDFSNATYDVADEELPAIDGEDGTGESLLPSAIKARPELVAQQRSLESSEILARAYRGGYGPSLSAVAGASENGTSLDDLKPGWNIGATISWPIFQGGLTRGLVREAEGNIDQARAALDTTKLQIRLDIEQALLNVKAAKARGAAANDGLDNAKERLRLAEGRYASGVGSVIELGDAQVAFTNAGAQVAQAQFNLSNARAQLLAALGRR